MSLFSWSGAALVLLCPKVHKVTDEHFWAKGKHIQWSQLQGTEDLRVIQKGATPLSSLIGSLMTPSLVLEEMGTWVIYICLRL